MKSHSLGKRSGLLIAGVILLVIAISFVVVDRRLHPPERSISWAAMAGDLDLLKKHETAGVSLDVHDPHAFGWTPLMAAIYHQQINIIQYLLTKNINVNLQDRRGDTALMWAITVEDTNTVKLLLKNGADVTVKNNDGADAFVFAETSSHRAQLFEWMTAAKSNASRGAR